MSETDRNNCFPNRKSTRLAAINYDSTGVYFLTICTKERKQLLSRIVGDGASTSQIFQHFTDVPRVELTQKGMVVEKYILSSLNVKWVKEINYVIMPNHIHILVFVKSQMIPRDVEAPSPTNRQNQFVPRFVSTLKRLCNKEIGYNIFQRSYYDHIIRNDRDLDEHIRYILENPLNWQLDELYSEEQI